MNDTCWRDKNSELENRLDVADINIHIEAERKK